MTKIEILDFLEKLPVGNRDNRRYLNVAISYIRTNLFDKNDFIAMKLWTKSDIGEELTQSGYLDCEENINKVLEGNGIGCIRELGDITDNDWDLIHYAIDDTEGLIREEDARII